MGCRNLVVVSDLHAGCRLGLAPPDPIPLKDGGTHQSSDIQRKVWEMWREFWDVWVPRVCRNEPWDLVINGDAIDGVHHQSTTQISHNFDDQLAIAEMCLGAVVNACRQLGGKYYHVKGTEAHVGQSGVYEEMLAKRLGAEPDESGEFARYDLWKTVGDDCLVHVMHHIGFTSSAAHEASAVNAELTSEYVEAARWHETPPDYVVRSHRHRYIGVEFQTAHGYGGSIVTPGWQLKTPYAWRVAGARISAPQIGGVVIRQGDEEHYYRRKVWGIGRSRTAA